MNKKHRILSICFVTNPDESLACVIVKRYRKYREYKCSAASVDRIIPFIENLGVADWWIADENGYIRDVEAPHPHLNEDEYLFVLYKFFS